VRLLKKHIHEHDKIAIGNSLSAVIYSYLYNIPLILNNAQPPQRFEYFEKDINLDFFPVVNNNKKICTRKSSKIFGNSKLELWQKLIFILSLNGHLPFSDKVASIRIEEEEQLKIISKNSKVIKIKCNKIYIFDDDNIFGLPSPEVSIDRNTVLDWMTAKPCEKHSFDLFETQDDFVQKVYFYPTERIQGSHKDIKDLVSISYLTHEQLHDYQYSDTYVKFKILKMMSDAGIKGSKNGYQVDNSEKAIHYKLKLESTRREVYKYQMNQYENTRNLFFNYQTPEDIIRSAPKKLENSFHEKLASKIHNDRKRIAKC